MHQCSAGSRLRHVLALVTFTLLAGSQASPAQQASSAPTQPTPPTGTGRVSVRVVAADNGAAVKRARVMLMGMPAPSSRPPRGSVTTTVSLEVSSGQQGGVSTQGAVPAATAGGAVRKEGETDETGVCTFTQLPAATYSVNVMPQGGFVRPTGFQEPVRLGEGDTQTVTIRLTRTGAIVGRVTDESGDPVVRAQVRALRRDGNRGRLGMTGSASTDDLGHFRLFDVEPGEYYVSAEVMSPMSSMMQPTSPEGVAKVGFAPTYYAGSASLDAARTVKVRSGEDTGGVEFALVRAPLGTVSGMAFDSQGNPLVSAVGGGASVQLTPRGDFYGMSRGGTVQKDGRFTIGNVPPGDYYVSATLFRGSGRDAYREGGFVPVSVNGDDVTVDVRTNTGATMSGTVVFEGQPPAGGTGVVLLNGTPAPRVSIYARPHLGGMQLPGTSFGPGPATVGDDNTFELAGLRGSVTLSANAGVALFKALLRGGEDVTGKPFELKGTERIDDLVVVLTHDTGALEGTVADAQGRAPAERTFVVIFPDDATRWFEGTPFVRTAAVMTEANLQQRPPRSAPLESPAPGVSPRPITPAQEMMRWTPVAGGFFLPRLLPGRYLVATSDGPSAGGSSFDREALEKLRARAVRVTVNAGEKSKVQVPAQPASK